MDDKSIVEFISGESYKKNSPQLKIIVSLEIITSNFMSIYANKVLLRWCQW